MCFSAVEILDALFAFHSWFIDSSSGELDFCVCLDGKRSVVPSGPPRLGFTWPSRTVTLLLFLVGLPLESLLHAIMHGPASNGATAVVLGERLCRWEGPSSHQGGLIGGFNGLSIPEAPNV